MSVQDWSHEQRLTVELRKALRGAGQAGAPTDFATLLPVEHPKGLSVGPGESLCALVRNRNGRVFCFTGDGVYVEAGAQFQQVRYNSLRSLDWISEEESLAKRAALKREFGDLLILHSLGGEKCELDQLGWAFQALFNFFAWAVRKNEGTIRGEQGWVGTLNERNGSEG